MFKSRHSFLILTLFIAILSGGIYALESIAPQCLDDIFYSSRITEDAGGELHFSTVPNQSPSDTIESVRNLRRIHNSRLGNMLYVILYSIGKQPLVCLVNTIGIVGFIIALSLLGCRRISIAGITSAAAASGLLLPVAERSLLWQSAAMNYGIGSLLLCLFLLGLRGTIQRPGSVTNTIFTASIALLCGIHHEGMGLPMLTALAAFALMGVIRRKHYPYCHLLFYTALLAAGFFFLITAPGAQARISLADGSLTSALPVGAALFIYRCLLLIPVFLFCLWKGRKSWFDSYTLYCIPPAVVVAIFGNTVSKWGGSCYFAAFFMLVYVAEIMGARLHTSGFKTLVTTTLAACCGLVWLFIHMSGFRSIYDHVMNQHPQNGVYCLNYFQEDYTYNWWMQFALPSSGMQHQSARGYQKGDYGNMICSLHRHEPMSVVVNQLITSPDIYHLFDCEPTDKPVRKQIGSLSVIRLPHLCEPIELSTKGYAVNKNGKKYPLCSHLSQNSEFKVMRTLLGKPCILISPAYENGFYYIAMEIPSCDIERIELPVYNAATRQDEILTVTTFTKK